MALKIVPPVAISSSTSRQSRPLMSPMTCAGRAFSSSPVRRLSMKAIGRSSRLANLPASLASPTSAATTTVFDRSSRLSRSHKTGTPDNWSAGIEKNPCVCGECRSTVSTRSAPAVANRSAISRAVIEMRGSSFLSLRAYGKYGSTAVTRRADECLSASRMMSSSTMFSDSGGHAVCTTNTSSSRTFSSILTFKFSLEKRVVCARPS